MIIPPRRIWPLALLASAAIGLVLLIDGAGKSSASYDEVAYLRLAAQWWRTGDLETIGRMGSPLTFLKLQQAPALWFVDRTGRSGWIDDPIAHQALLLPMARIGALWLWGAGLVLTACWARSLYGPSAAAMAALLFALSPNLLAHGGLITMELPLLVFWTASVALFSRFLESGDRRAFLASSAAAGVAFSCKFTTILLPPILALGWLVDRRLRGDCRPIRLLLRVCSGMLAFVVVLLATDLLVTGFATMTPSARVGSEHPSLSGRFGPGVDGWLVRLAERRWPQDWVALAIQMIHQRSGGMSYLLGQRRSTGWWYYYLVALAVKVPLGVWLLFGGRAAAGVRGLRSGWRRPSSGEVLIAMSIGAMLVLTALGSKRNYGLRYLLPLAPSAIVWVSRLAEGPRGARALSAVGLLLMAVTVARCHPHELSYFNALAGGTAGGRFVLADSNLDWGQGARALARLQRIEPAYRDLTTYYFGDTDPGHYGVVGVRFVVDAAADHPGLPARFRAETRFVAVSASLQHGPWGPEGYFRALDGVPPDRLTDDGTIAIYRSDRVFGSEQVAAPGEAVLQPVGQLGDAADDHPGVRLEGGLGREVPDDDEIFLTPQHLDGEVPLDGHGVELQQRGPVPLVRRPAHRHQGDDRPVLPVGADVADVHRLVPLRRHRDVQPVAVSGRMGPKSGAFGELANHPRRIGVGRVGHLVGSQRLLGRLGIRLDRAQRQPAAGAEAGRGVVLPRASGADDRGEGHGERTPGGRTGRPRPSLPAEGRGRSSQDSPAPSG
ncbi:ArnT family glycosyltransferase [Tautonia sociabilis]|uniref:Phospholipid carrier-dependent glycosyltransferase n=1 Tax=Tautonia sociabilis TaxID=2080755 RepID=A0A432MFQ4_9BACT|nr:glycosyltransferase family 39 protein [Tautonia sociabilis]RUL84984.1 phospholipid carrier-dependent glycosyltransferase [Tautonia sociabilis]